jgi:hypothetical protein
MTSYNKCVYCGKQFLVETIGQHMQQCNYAEAAESIFSSSHDPDQSATHSRQSLGGMAPMSSLYSSNLFTNSTCEEESLVQSTSDPMDTNSLTSSLAQMDIEGPTSDDDRQEQQEAGAALKFSFASNATQLSAMASFGLDLHHIAHTYKIPDRGYAELTELINQVVKYVDPGKLSKRYCWHIK